MILRLNKLHSQYQLLFLNHLIYTNQDIDWVEHITIVDANTGETITIPTPVTPTP